MSQFSWCIFFIYFCADNFRRARQSWSILRRRDLFAADRDRFRKNGKPNKKGTVRFNRTNGGVCQRSKAKNVPKHPSYKTRCLHFSLFFTTVVLLQKISLEMIQYRFWVQFLNSPGDTRVPVSFALIELFLIRTKGKVRRVFLSPSLISGSLS